MFLNNPCENVKTWNITISNYASVSGNISMSITQKVNYTTYSKNDFIGFKINRIQRCIHLQNTSIINVTGILLFVFLNSSYENFIRKLTFFLSETFSTKSYFFIKDW